MAIDREKLRRYYEAGWAARTAAPMIPCSEGVAYHWYRRWLAQDGDKAPTCPCGRELIHRGRCWARSHKAQARWPVYTGPEWIGRALEPQEIAMLRALEAQSVNRSGRKSHQIDP
jgi:hypothetical protein